MQINRIKQSGLLLSLVFFIGLAAGCSISQAESGTQKDVSQARTSETDPEIVTALSLIDKMPDSTTGYNRLAVLHIQKARQTGDFGLYTKAETAIDRALQIAPNDESSRKLKASLLLTFHRFTEALDMGKQLNQEFPDDSFVFGVLTDANVELGNYADAVGWAQKMVDRKPNSASYSRGGHLRSLNGDHAGAVELLTLAAKTMDPKDSEGQSWCLVQLGDEYFNNGNFAKAASIYDEALAILPDFYLAAASKGKVMAAQNDLDGAITILTSVLNRVPNVDSAILLGDIFSKKGDTENAKRQYELAELMERKIGLNNDQKRLALMWADHGIRLEDALEISKREYAQRKDIYTEDALAWCLYKNGQVKEARESILRAMRLKTNDARLLYHAGMIEVASGNRTEAIRLLSLSLKLNPAFDLLQSEVAKKTLLELRG